MSGEFHEIHGSNFMWSVLDDSASTRPTTGEPVADALGRLYTALAPLERAVAWHQAFDGSHAAVVLAAVHNRAAVKEAIDGLAKAVAAYDNLVDDLIRDHDRKEGEAK